MSKRKQTKRVSAATIPLPLLKDRLAWLAQAKARAESDDAPAPDAQLLVTGLAVWQIGIVSADIRQDAEDATPYIALTFAKPEKRRSEQEAETSERWLDPEAVFLLQAHLFYGRRMSLEHGRGAAGGIYHYPVLHIAGGEHYRYVLRLLVDVSQGRLAKQREDNHYDLRRKSLGRTISQAQAAILYGRGQRRPSIVRQDVIDTSTAAWRKGALPLAKTEYRDLLLEGYQLLDLKPLKIDART